MAVIIIVRIDLILSFFDKTSEKYQYSSKPDVKPSDIQPSSNLVPINKDLAIQNTPRKMFFSMMTDFQSMPDETIKDKAIEILKSNPTLFDEKKDPDLEASIFQLRVYLLQKNKVTQNLILELMKLLRGENLEMLKGFFSLAIDIDLADFLNVYSKSSDSNCLLMAYLGDRLSDIERYNELSERLIALETFIASESSVAVRPYALKCHIVLKLKIDKLKSIVTPFEEPVAPDADPLTAPGESP